MAVNKPTNDKTTSFEETLWGSINKLRGNVDKGFAITLSAWVMKKTGDNTCKME